LKSVLVIGGGPAGMMAAGIAAQRGLKAALAERNPILGKKLRITGKGRCNLTNCSDAATHMANAVDNPKFLHSALSAFTSADLMKLIEGLGVPLKVERGNRVFPESDMSSDIVGALARFLKKSQVQTLVGERIESLAISNGVITGARASSGLIGADCVILATGGMSYPLTGSTGDGYKLASQAGHSIVAPKPALAAITVSESWVGELEGLSLKNVTLALLSNSKKIYKDLGEMLFTDKGVSGPLALSASCYLRKAPSATIAIDLKPGLDEAQLDVRILRDFSESPNKELQNILPKLLPAKMIPVAISLSGIPAEKRARDISKEERQRLTRLLKRLELTVKGTAGFAEAIITSGGVNAKEVSPSTMESKLVKGLYFAGEILDVCSLTGGFNLQVAFSTGYLAGMKCLA
jgi:predicted Rossmann fold flavoprotein